MKNKLDYSWISLRWRCLRIVLSERLFCQDDHALSSSSSGGAWSHSRRLLGAGQPAPSVRSDIQGKTRGDSPASSVRSERMSLFSSRASVKIPARGADCLRDGLRGDGLRGIEGLLGIDSSATASAGLKDYYSNGGVVENNGEEWSSPPHPSTKEAPARLSSAHGSGAEEDGANRRSLSHGGPAGGGPAAALANSSKANSEAGGGSLRSAEFSPAFSLRATSGGHSSALQNQPLPSDYQLLRVMRKFVCQKYLDLVQHHNDQVHLERAYDPKNPETFSGLLPDDFHQYHFLYSSEMHRRRRRVRLEAGGVPRVVGVDRGREGVVDHLGGGLVVPGGEEMRGGAAATRPTGAARWLSESPTGEWRSLSEQSSSHDAWMTGVFPMAAPLAVPPRHRSSRGSSYDVGPNYVQFSALLSREGGTSSSSPRRPSHTNELHAALRSDLAGLGVDMFHLYGKKQAVDEIFSAELTTDEKTMLIGGFGSIGDGTGRVPLNGGGMGSAGTAGRAPTSGILGLRTGDGEEEDEGLLKQQRELEKLLESLSAYLQSFVRELSS